MTKESAAWALKARKGLNTMLSCTSWLHAGQLLGQRSSIGAHIQEGPIWLEEPQVAHSEGLERAFKS